MPEDNTTSVPLTRIALYKHGIGYFERVGKVQGPGQIELMCGPDEIDDMLKSLVVLDRSGKRISAVTYESAKPLEARMAEFGFDLRMCKGLIDLIAQIKGAPVTVEAGKERLRARVVGLDEVQHAVGEGITTAFQLVLYTDATSLRRVPLSDIQKITIDDTALAIEIQQQLELLFQAVRKKDRKLLRVQIQNEGEHEITLAYSIPCPIWKTSYRLIWMPEDKLLIQGTAIVDNSQEEDWERVKMTLVSASPVSFIQPLYDPVQPERPVIGVQGVRSSGPYVAERAAAVKTKASAENVQQRMLAPQAAPMGAGDTWGKDERRERLASLIGAVESGLPVSSQQSGELFEYQIEELVTVPRNSSALITVVLQLVEGERVSLYNEHRNRKHPYAAVHLKNTTGLTLESGPVTVMENDSYAGEALLDVLKPDDARFLPYALDQSVHVLTRQEHSRKPVWRVRAWQGYLYLDYKEVNKRTYTIENISDREKHVYIEHSVTPSLSYVGTEKPVEITEHFYRFKTTVKPKETYMLVVPEEWESCSQLWLEDFGSGELPELKWLLAQNFIDEKFATFLKEVVKLREEIMHLIMLETGLKEQVATYQGDQERARENVRTLGSSGDRYRKAIDEAEDRINETEIQRREVASAIAKKRSEFSSMIRQQFVSELADVVHSHV